MTDNSTLSKHQFSKSVCSALQCGLQRVTF